MKEFSRQSRSVGTLLLLAGICAPASVVAQRQTRMVAPPEDAIRFVVLPMRSTDKKLGVEAGDAIRDKIGDEFDMKRDKFFAVSKQNTCAVLDAAGFVCDSAPNSTTARLLSQQLRADEYLEGQVSRPTTGGVRLETRMTLTRNSQLSQPLPVADGRDVGRVAEMVAKSLRDARKQLVDYRACELAINNQKPKDAMPAARRAIVAYPNSTIGRLCLAQAFVNSKESPDSVIAITRKVIEIDPRSSPATELLADAYIGAKLEDSSVAAMTRLLTLNPGDQRTIAKVIEFLGTVHRPELAIPIIEQALVDNPGDPQLTRLYWLILLQGKQYKKAVAAGETLIKTDTAAADSTFYLRLSQAYAVDSQPRLAAEAAARGVAKFPSSGTLLVMQGRMLRQAGQTQQSIDVLKRLIQKDPKAEHAYLYLAQAYLELGQTDSAFAALKEAVTQGEDKALVGNTMVVEGNRFYKLAAALKPTSGADSVARRQAYQKAVAVLAQADQIASTENTKFLLGVSAFQVGDAAVRENVAAKSCEIAKLAQDSFVMAQTNVPAGGKQNPQVAGQLMGALGQYTPVVDAQVKKFCK
ncbi:MAG: tetratricopeptide repeat protein [Gemmatimonadaceae bacterium]